MRPSCPYEHVSYSVWRLCVLRQLCTPPDSYTPRFLSRLTSWTLPAPVCRRRFTSTHKPLGCSDTTRPSIDSGAGEKDNDFHPTDQETRGVARSRTQSARKSRSIKAWTPLREQGPADLNNLAVSLQKLARNRQMSAREQAPTSKHEQTDVSPRSLPESPLLRRIRKEKPRKRRPAPEEYRELENNLWAQILASPLRHCQGTSVRVPSGLMLTWDLTKNSKDGITYLMPRDIANFEELRSPPVKTDIAGHAETVLSTPGEATDSDGPPPTTASTPSQLLQDAQTPSETPKPPKSPGLWMLPNQSMLKHFSQEFVLRRRPVSRLFSTRWHVAISVAAKSADGPHPASNAKWYPDFDARLRKILEMRVLAAFEGFAADVTERGSEVSIAFLPQKNDDAKVIEAKDETLQSASDFVGGAFLYLGPLDSFHALFQDPKSTSTLRATLDRSNEVHISRSTTHSAFSQPLSSPPPPHPMIPPLLTLNNTHRLPVFPLQHLLSSPDHQSELDALIRNTSGTNPPTLPTHPHHSTQPKRQRPEPDGYLLHVPAHSQPSRVLMTEIWRLWRYIGGRKALALDLAPAAHDRPGVGAREDANGEAAEEEEDADGEAPPPSSPTYESDAHTGRIFSYRASSNRVDMHEASLLWQTGDVQKVKRALRGRGF